MKKIAVAILIAVFSAHDASAFLGFGSSDDDAAETNKPAKLSVIMRHANDLFDEAEELAAERKRPEALAKYRETLAELDSLREKYPEQTDVPSFRNRRLHCITRIDAFKLEDSAMTTYPVNVTDTTELQRRYNEKHGKKTAPAETPPPETPPQPETPRAEERPAANSAPTPPSTPAAPPLAFDMAATLSSARAAIRSGNTAVARERLMKALEQDPRNREALYLLAFAAWTEGDSDLAGKLLDHLVGRAVRSTVPARLSAEDAPALVLYAAVKSAADEYALAVKALDLAIAADPESPVAYFNMAIMLSEDAADLGPAREYYKLGIKRGGARDASIEARLGGGDLQ